MNFLKLSYYLFNENMTNFNQLILHNKVNENNNFFVLEPKNPLDFDCQVYIQRNKQKEPKWIEFLEKDLNIPERDKIKNTVNSFVILIKLKRTVDTEEKSYFFAVTGGFGFTAINKNNLENNFGLKVALNTIDSKELKAFDVRNIDLKTKQKRVLINKGSELGEFDLDFEQDLINLVSGKSKDEGVGTSIRGTTSSLSLNSDVAFSQLGKKCNQLLDLFLSDDYKESFSFIDNIKILKDPEITNSLNQRLFDTLANREKDYISLAYPDMIEYERCSKYKVYYGRKTVETEEVTLYDIYTLLDQINFNSPTLINKIKIVGLDDSDTAVTSAVTLNHFIIYETQLADDKYIFSLNNWYKIDNNYFTKVQNEIREIELLEIEDFLTEIEEGESEGNYNERQDTNYFLCLDKKNYQVTGSRSKIEVCDLFSIDKHFVCVKKETASATLSHLFAQGSVSMKLIRDSVEYRKFLIDRAKEKFGAINYDEDTFPYSECTLVYAISTKKNEDIRDSLPFFSKVNLLHHVSLIKRLGIKVAMYKINVANKALTL
ncbi:DUF6119 family protein [Priestia megaterium]